MADKLIPQFGRELFKRFFDMGDTSHSEAVVALGMVRSASASFVRQSNTTPYTANDVVGPASGIGSALALAIGRANNSSLLLQRLVLRKTGVNTGHAYRVHLFSAAPTVTSADNDPMVISVGRALSLGYFDITMDQVYGDGCVGYSQQGQQLLIKLGASTMIYAVLQALAGNVPASAETITLEAIAISN